ncbi:MAG TPA: glycosyltransferase family 39 protein [Solirubrobacteraceae bacterium]
MLAVSTKTASAKNSPRITVDTDASERISPALAWAGVALATAVAVALRSLYVGDQDLGYEEVFTASVVSHASLTGVWHAIKATESTPPLFYLLTWLWVKLAASHTAVALRTSSLVAGSLTPPAAFLAMRSVVGQRTGLVVAWLCAISPLLVVDSIYARSYALLVLVSTLSVWALGALLKRRSRLAWALWVASATACLWTHYFTAFLVTAEAAVLFFRLPRDRRRLLASMAALAAATAPLWPLLVTQSGASERTAYIAARPLGRRLEETVRQFVMGTNVPHAWLEGAGLLIVLLAALYGLVRTYRRPAIQVLLILAAIGAGLPIVSALSGIDDHFLARNVLGVWICLAPLAAYGLTRLRGLPLVAYGAICLATVVAVQSDWRYHGATDWRDASALVQSRASNEVVAVMPGFEYPVPAFYMHRSLLSTPVRTTDLWVMVEPARGAGQRALNPVGNPPLASLWGSGLQPVGEIDHRGFRLIHLHAATPVTVPPVPFDNGPPSAPRARLLAP